MRKILLLAPVFLILLSDACFGPPMPLCDGVECPAPALLSPERSQRLITEAGKARAVGDLVRLEGFALYAKSLPVDFDLRQASELSLALTQMQAGQWQAALATLEEEAKGKGLLADYFLQAYGVSQEALDRSDGAEGAYRRLLDQHPGSVWSEEARARLARLCWQQGRWQEIVILSDHLPAANGEGELHQRFKLSDRASLRPLAWYRAGALEHLGYGPGAMDIYRARFVGYPSESFDSSDGLPATAKAALSPGRPAVPVAMLNPSQWLERTDRLQKLNRNAEAAQELMAVIEAGPEGWTGLGERLLEEYGKSRLRSRDYTGMEQELTQLAVRLRDRPALASLAAYWKGRAWARQGRYDEAVRMYDRALKSGTAKSKARSDYYAGLTLEEMERTKDARVRYQRVLQHATKGEVAEESLWRLGFDDYRQGRLKDALRWFGKLSDLRPEDSFDNWRVRYFFARTLERSGNLAEAQTLFREIIAQSPPGLYAYWSSRRLSLPGTRPCDWRPDGCPWETGAMERPAEGRLALTPVQESAPAGRHARKAELLFRMGLAENGEREIRQLEDQEMDESLRLQLGRMMGQYGRYHSAQRMVRYFTNSLLLEPLAAQDLESWRLAYQPGYRDWVSDASDRQSLPPGLVHGLIEEESRYQPDAVSPAGAQGLMQLMPATANRVGATLGWPETATEDLHEPHLNIMLGTAYLKQMIGQFDGRSLLALAAYNAGPAAVERWLADDPDAPCEMLVESIAYSETRRYVKKVVGSALAFDLLYRLDSGAGGWPGPESPLCVGN